MKKTVKYLKVAGNVFIWVFVIFSVLMTLMVFSAQKNKDGVPSFFGKSQITILTESMHPTIKKGDLIFIETLSTEQKKALKKDDIITFFSDLDGDGTDEINTHRIVEVQVNGGNYTYITRGDNNPINDETPVLYTKVIGKYTGTRIGGVGSFINFLSKPTGFLLVIVLPLFAFFLFELYRFITVAVSLKTKKAGISPQDEEEIKRRAIEEYLRQQKEAEKKGTTEDNENK